jgi:1-acyl-sn-glycerol-3-phosphate acyltransferase
MQGPVALKVFDSLARIWSSRCALLLRLRLQVTGVEALKELTHQTVIVLNHESLLDFAMGFYVVGGADTGRGKRLATRFIAAKDHFKDNFFLYSVIGMGRAMEQAGMIFVDRKIRGGGERVILESVEAMRESGVDVAIFPQGTRAIAHFDTDGLPTGAGFYTTTRGPIVGVGHFKSGASRIVAELSKHQDVNILLVSIQGAATAIPAKRFDIYPGATIRYHIAPPITVEKGTDTEAETLNHRIELALRNNAQVHERLLARWQIECHQDQAAHQALESALAPWDQAQEPVPFAVLDAILGRTPNERPALLARFEETALLGATTEQWIEFRAKTGAPWGHALVRIKSKKHSSPAQSSTNSLSNSQRSTTLEQWQPQTSHNRTWSPAASLGVR